MVLGGGIAQAKRWRNCVPFMGSDRRHEKKSLFFCTRQEMDVIESPLPTMKSVTATTATPLPVSSLLRT